MNILIATESPAASRLGGPGRFTPVLYKGLNDVDIKYSFLGMFAGYLYSDPEEIKYFDVSDDNKTNQSLISTLKNNSVIRVVFGTALSMHKRRLNNKKLNEMGIDCIHAHDFRTVDLFSGFSGKIILTNHFKGSLYNECIQYKDGMNKPWLKKYYLEIERRAIKRADVITFPSKSAQSLLEQDHPELASAINGKAIVVYSGIVTPKTIGSGGNNEFGYKYVLNIGNHIPDKGVLDSIKVFNEIYGSQPEVNFINVGMHGIETEKLMCEAQKLGLAERVHLLGIKPYNEVVNLLSHAECVLHTPKRVVFDLSLLEAMAMEVPVISSRAMGNVEALGDDHPFYVETGDESLSLLFDKQDFTDENKMNCIVKQKNRFLDKFSFDVMLNGYLELYSKIVPPR